MLYTSARLKTCTNYSDNNTDDRVVAYGLGLVARRASTIARERRRFFQRKLRRRSGPSGSRESRPQTKNLEQELRILVRCGDQLADSVEARPTRRSLSYGVSTILINFKC